MLHLRRLPSVGTILGIIALFVSLGGVGYSATGGTFILGNANTASTPSSLSAPVAGKTLQLTNTSTGVGATALGLSVASGKPPLTVNSGTKVPNLNADRLDGLDSTSFLRSTAKATDSDKLDGVDASAFLRASTYTRIGDFDGTDDSNGAFYARMFCDPGDILLNGGYHFVDPGTQIIGSWADDAFQDSHFVYWVNDATPDSIRLIITCLNQV